MSALHHNAALRVLRREMTRLDDAKHELVGAIGDHRLQPGVAIQQAAQCEREITELREAHNLLETIFSAGAAMRIAAE